MTGFMQDVHFGLRQLRKSFGFASVAAFTIALGIGANTAIFSLVSGILLRPLPYPRPAELVSITGTYPKGAFSAMRDQVHTMDVATYAEGHEYNLTHVGDPIRLTGTPVSAEFFSVLGARPQLGRAFVSGEDSAGNDRYAILSYELWQDRFGGNTNVIGRSVELEGVNREIIGVMPASFHFPSTKTQVWIPLHNDPRNQQEYWAGDFMPVFGRLRPGTTPAQATAEIRLFQSRVFTLFPWEMPRSWNADLSVVELRIGMVGDVKTRLLLLLGAVALVLLIACANVANLMLSRAATREKEMGIRTALGAAPRRIVRQLLTESVLLAVIGALLGFALAALGLSTLKASLPANTPRLEDVSLDWRVLLFTGSLAILTGLAFGLAPALQSSKTALSEAINSAGRGAAVSLSRGLRGSLATAEVALSVMLVIAAGLLIRSFWALSHVDPGFRAEHIVTARITPNQSFCSEIQRCLTFYRDVLQQLHSAPGVSDAAVVNTLPLGGRVSKRSLQIDGFVGTTGEKLPLFWLDVISPDYFNLMGIPLLSGRAFTAADETGDSPVAIISASSAQRYWPGKNPVGKHIRFSTEDEWRTVVGVIQDVRAYDLEHNVPDWIHGTVYVPYGPKATLEEGGVPADMTIVVQTAADDGQVSALLHRAVTSLSSEVPVTEIRTMRTVVSDAVTTPASTTFLFSTFATVALVLGMVGIYGVLSFLVSKRRKEIGLRMALGARKQDILLLVMKEGATFAVAGIAIGVAAASVLAKLLATQLYGVSPMDSLTYSSVAALVALVTMAACYVPARRAMQVDPLVALRND
ncbi:MAG TPA: ABC transporter permease [Candidatus Sulfotelmatobacter sp.]|nr:ABC transporter permease [Candidatus Sulfotelmatobacter sp.]